MTPLLHYWVRASRAYRSVLSQEMKGVLAERRQRAGIPSDEVSRGKHTLCGSAKKEDAHFVGTSGAK